MVGNKFTYIFVSLFLHFTFADPLVELPDGTIRGRKLTTSNNVSFNAFQGIPFARPPLGEYRFQAPVPPEKWEGILNTTQDGYSCIATLKNPYTSGQESEDCLFINVYAPVLNNVSDAEKLPVLFWIYGGAFILGSSSKNTYGPDFIVEEGVILVTSNYRLGPFGFLSTGDSVIPGNAGLKDQNLALKWTKDNIALFGGDPDKITIFGQSAGGASVGLHIVSELSAGLFRGAISQSGSALVPWTTIENMKSSACSLLRAVTNSSDVTDDCSSETVLETLRDISAEKINVLTTISSINFLPVLEPHSEGAFLSRDRYNYQVIKNGEINKVPLMIGTTSSEYLGLILDLSSFLSDKTKQYDENPTLLIPDNLQNVSEANATEEIEDIRKIYIDDDVSFENNPGALVNYLSDNTITRGVRKHAELQSEHTDVYYYLLSYEGSLKYTSNTVQGAEGAGHSSELPYLFAQQNMDNANWSKYPESDLLAHNRLIKLWTNFAKYLNPTPEATDLLQNIVWPTVKGADNFKYLEIGNDLEIKSDLKDTTYNKWVAIYDKWAKKPYLTF